jgi:hypothetical protein
MKISELSADMLNFRKLKVLSFRKYAWFVTFIRFICALK